MVFAPRKRKNWRQSLSDTVWPQSGWNRALRYIGFRIARMKGETGGIARGFAWGVSISFTPLIFGHMILAVGISWLIGANLFAAALGTIIGNPLTFPFLWAASFYVGNWMMGRDLSHIKSYFNIEYFKNNFHDLFWPTLVGSIPLVLISWVITYLMAHYLVLRYRNYRLTHPHKKIKRNKK